MATSARSQPPWQAPPLPARDVSLPPLKIWNSLTRSKTPFVPINWESKVVKWYVCGPTVYNDAHLGHARNYVTTDIIRRIMQGFFKFQVEFVMNITDVDDKIILRGRQQHLLDVFLSKHPSIDADFIKTSMDALKAYVAKNLPLLKSKVSSSGLSNDIAQKYGPVLRGKSLSGGPAGDEEAKIKMHVTTVQVAFRAMSSLDYPYSYLELQEILLPYLDSLYGSSVDARDHGIFTKLTKRYEDRFMEDMKALNCLDPDEVTRVTEYGPQIVAFVQKIQDNDFAYTTSDGSVYFDIAAFEAAHNHYARLEPWSRNDTKLLAEGEGSLINQVTEKRSPADFALWKSSKPGEPSWPSPWGNGRPGWHIECSVMASDKLGGRIDIHSGGIDLAFPHHDNELAQSEAFWTEKDCKCEHQWVNYFMHMGHLSIQGSKMSKSLKNFITIREALDRGDWTARGLRIVFLLSSWKDGIEITDDIARAGSAWEDKVNNFFIKAKDIVEHPSEVGNSANVNGRSVTIQDIHDGQTKPSTAEQEMSQALRKAESQVYEALCDSFNTPLVMATLSELISVFNGLDKSALSSVVVQDVAKWVTTMVNMFGLNGPALLDVETIGWSGMSIPEAAKQYIYPLAKVRDELRRKARSSEGLTSQDLDIVNELGRSDSDVGQTKGSPYAKIVDEFAECINTLKASPSLSKDVLRLCDRLRDVSLWNHGIYLEDRQGNQPALVRPVTRELLAAREEKEDKERQKVMVKGKAQKEAAATANQGRQSHLEMFKTSDYIAWDEEGVPTKDSQGEELSKSRTKKLKKDLERQKKLHEKWLLANK